MYARFCVVDRWPGGRKKGSPGAKRCLFEGYFAGPTTFASPNWRHEVRSLSEHSRIFPSQFQKFPHSTRKKQSNMHILPPTHRSGPGFLKGPAVIQNNCIDQRRVVGVGDRHQGERRTRILCIAKETYAHSKRALCTQQKSPMYTAKEPYVHSIRALCTQQKSPMYIAKAPYVHSKRALCI